jgi:SAM-dependent methyltransferase
MAAHDSLDKDWQDPVSRSNDKQITDTTGKFSNSKTTDSEPVSVIVSKFSHVERIQAVDMGCGAARYDILLYRYLGDKLKLACLDAETETLKNLTTYFSRHNVRNFSSGSTEGGAIPFAADSLDCVLSFNTIHKYDVPQFLSESIRVLKNSGYLFVYTRLREQNEKTDRGQYTLEALKRSIDAMENAAVESVVFFAFNRLAAFEQMHFRSPSPHEITNPFYSPEELKEVIKEFSLNIEDVFNQHQQVRWFDENVLFVIKKENRNSLEYLKIAASSFRGPGMVV